MLRSEEEYNMQEETISEIGNRLDSYRVNLIPFALVLHKEASDREARIREAVEVR